MASEQSKTIFQVNRRRTSQRSGTGRDDKFKNTGIAKKGLAENSIFQEGIKQWNGLPIEIRSKKTGKILGSVTTTYLAPFNLTKCFVISSTFYSYL